MLGDNDERKGEFNRGVVAAARCSLTGSQSDNFSAMRTAEHTVYREPTPLHLDQSINGHFAERADGPHLFLLNTHHFRASIDGGG